MINSKDIKVSVVKDVFGTTQRVIDTVLLDARERLFGTPWLLSLVPEGVEFLITNWGENGIDDNNSERTGLCSKVDWNRIYYRTGFHMDVSLECGMIVIEVSYQSLTDLLLEELVGELLATYATVGLLKSGLLNFTSKIWCGIPMMTAWTDAMTEIQDGRHSSEKRDKLPWIVHSRFVYDEWLHFYGRNHHCTEYNQHQTAEFDILLGRREVKISAPDKALFDDREFRSGYYSASFRDHLIGVGLESLTLPAKVEIIVSDYHAIKNSQTDVLNGDLNPTDSEGNFFSSGMPMRSRFLDSVLDSEGASIRPIVIEVEYSTVVNMEQLKVFATLTAQFYMIDLLRSKKLVLGPGVLTMWDGYIIHEIYTNIVGSIMEGMEGAKALRDSLPWVRGMLEIYNDVAWGIDTHGHLVYGGEITLKPTDGDSRVVSHKT